MMLTEENLADIERYKLTPSEAMIFSALKEKMFLSHNDVAALMVSESNKVYVNTSIDRRTSVMICMIRKKTLADIKNLRGSGYQLTNLNNS